MFYVVTICELFSYILIQPFKVIMIFVMDVILITRQPNDAMLSVWKEYMFRPLKSCKIILKINLDPISILSIQVHILNILTYLSHSEVFTTARNIFLDNNYPCFSTFLFYYRFTKRLSKSVYGHLRSITSLWTWHTCWYFQLTILPKYLILPALFT